ncbi:MAG TPA: hypothetical protein VGH72_33470 [Pseudonocardia sp.]
MKIAEILLETNWRPLHRGCAQQSPEKIELTSAGAVHCACGVTLGIPPEEYHAERPIVITEQTDVQGEDLPAIGTRTAVQAAVAEHIQGAPSEAAADAAGLDAPWEDGSPPWDTSDESSGYNPDMGTQEQLTGVMVLPESAVVPVDPIESVLAAIDPTQVYTPADVELQLVSIAQRLEQGQYFQRRCVVEAHNAALEYELAHAKAIIESTGRSKEVREADALVACEQLYRRKMETETLAKAVADTMHNLRSMLSGFQSIARSVGASFNAPNFNT